MIFTILIFYLYFYISFSFCSNVSNNNDINNYQLVKLLLSQLETLNTESDLTNNSSKINNYIDGKDTESNIFTNKRYDLLGQRSYRSLRMFFKILEQDTENLIQTINEMKKVIDVKKRQSWIEQQIQMQVEQQKQKEFNRKGKCDGTLKNHEHNFNKNLGNSSIYLRDIRNNSQSTDTIKLPLIETKNYTDKNMENNSVNLYEKNEKLKLWEKQIETCKEILRNTKSLMPSTSSTPQLLLSPSSMLSSLSLSPSSSFLTSVKKSSNMVNMAGPNTAPGTLSKGKIVRILTKERQDHFNNQNENNMKRISVPMWPAWNKWSRKNY